MVAPNRAIKTQGRAKTVQVLDAAGTPQTRTVQVGLSNDTLTEIVSGLQAGDKVVIPATGTAAVSAGVGGVALGGLAGGPPAGGPRPG